MACFLYSKDHTQRRLAARRTGAADDALATHLRRTGAAWGPHRTAVQGHLPPPTKGEFDEDVRRMWKQVRQGDDDHLG